MQWLVYIPQSLSFINLCSVKTYTDIYADIFATSQKHTYLLFLRVPTSTKCLYPSDQPVTTCTTRSIWTQINHECCKQTTSSVPPNPPSLPFPHLSNLGNSIHCGGGGVGRLGEGKLQQAGVSPMTGVSQFTRVQSSIGLAAPTPPFPPPGTHYHWSEPWSQCSCTVQLSECNLSKISHVT